MNKEKTTMEIADELIAKGKKLTMGVTVPLFLFVIGFFFMPLGLVLWAIGLVIFLTVFKTK